jgi:hypothetical protein
MRRVAVLSAAVLAGALLSPSSALATDEDPRSHDDRWIAVEDEFAFVLPNGDTFTEDDPPMAGEEEFAPPIGTRLFIGEVLYATEDGKTRGDEVGRTHIECTAQAVPVDFLCSIAFVFDGGSQLHGTVLVNVAEEEGGGEPAQFDIAVTGGTDDYDGASGEVSLLDLTDPGDPAAETVTLYEAHLE